MKFTADDFRRLYADMADTELLSMDRNELGEIARQCYDAELRRRGVDPAIADAAEISEPEPEFGGLPDPSGIVSDGDVEQRAEEDLAPAGIFDNREDATAARERLQSAFIPSFLENDQWAADWTPRNASGSFRLLVPGSYLAQAREILGAAE